MKKYKLFFTIVFVFLGIMLSTPSYAMSQHLNNLNFNIKINNNGSVSITEIWDAELYDTNTLFKTFTKNSKFKEIADVSITELDENGNKIKSFKNSEAYKYHENKDYFHATDDDTGNFEIAWGVSANGNEHRFFRLNYTIYDCINVYNDCAEFYWQVIGNQWSIDTYKITGTVLLPSEVVNIDDFRVWAHGPLHGEIHKTNNNSCFFSIENMPTNTFLELRLVFPTYIVNNAINIKNINNLDNILQEEQKNADKANKQREISKLYSKIGLVISLIISGIFGFFSLKNFIKLKIEYNKANIFKEKFDFKYFRDIPNSQMDPAEATIFAYNKIDDKNMISSLLMSLAYKKAITIKPGNNKDNTEILLNLNDNSTSNLIQLTEGERYLGGYLEKIGKSFSIKKFEKYIDSHAESFYNLINRIKKSSSTNLIKDYKYIDSNIQSLKAKLETRAYTCLIFIMIYLFIISWFFMILSTISRNILFIAIMLIILIYLYSMFHFFHLKRKINIYTEVGTEEKAKWRGLKNFMKNFSLLDEREIPELELWEQYLVYATGFGIAQKVLKKLKTKYPELSDSNYLNNYSCFYIANNHMFSSTVNNSINKAISVHNAQVAASSFSSGSGSGGGFSSGGGGGRWWWPAVAEDKKQNKKKREFKNGLSYIFSNLIIYCSLLSITSSLTLSFVFSIKLL